MTSKQNIAAAFLCRKFTTKQWKIR